MSAKTIIANAKKAVQESGSVDIATLSKMFNEADTNHNAYLENDEIEKLLKRLGLKLKARELKIVKKELDPDDTEKVYLTNFIEFFGKEIPDTRIDTIKEMFKTLSPEGEKKITVDQLKKRFGNNEYTIIGGRRVVTDQLLKDIVALFDMDNDGTITESDFINYYRDFNAKVESDELFNKIVKASWSF